MTETSNFELFYDVLDESINKLYEIKHDRFFKLLVDIGKNIIANDVLQKEATTEQREELLKIYERLSDVPFNVEEIRRAFQMMVLRALKEENLKNGDITPDTIGFFVGYLINKLMPNAKKLNILDPVVGSGNFLYSVANHLDCDLHLFGIDNIKEILDIASIQGDLLNYDVEMLLNGNYPFQLRQRINSPKGHLSNYDSSKYLSTFIGDKTKYVLLAHLSEENNTEKLAYETLVNRLEMDNKYVENVIVTKQDKETELISI
jgi:hypothetical protein